MPDTARSAPQRRWLPLLCLLATLGALLAHRAFLIATSETIAKDGTLYIAMAERWASNPGGVVRKNDFPPGYPALVAWTHAGLSSLGLGDGERGWTAAARLVALLASLAAMGALWWFTSMTFNWRAAALAVLLFGLGRKWAVLGSDALSDSPAVAFALWAVVLGLLASKLLARGRPGALLLAAGVGLASAAGYLVRPEALLPAMFIGGLWLVNLVRLRTHLALRLAALLLMAASLLALAGPYMVAIGGLTKKKQLSDVLPTRSAAIEPVRSEAGPVATAPATASDAATPKAKAERKSRGLVQACYRFLAQSVEAMNPIAAVMVGIWFITWALTRPLAALGRWIPARVEEIQPRAEPTAVNLATWAIMTPLLIGLYMNVGYLSHRHLMLPVTLLASATGGGAMILLRWLDFLLERMSLPRAVRLAAGGLLVTALVAGIVLPNLEPMHDSRISDRRAGEYLAAHAASDDTVFSNSSLTLHYAGRNEHLLLEHSLSADGIRAVLQQSMSETVWLSLSDSVLEARPGLARLVSAPPFVTVARILGSEDDDRLTIIYRIRTADLEGVGP